jgi:putative membrane protein
VAQWLRPGMLPGDAPCRKLSAVTYLWIKALHILAVMTWMAGVFYIFRLFAYHTKHRSGAATAAVFREMEWKMLRIVMLPAAIASIALGVAMLTINAELLSARWLQVKLAAVLGMLAYHWYAERTFARLRRDDYFLTEGQARMLHVVPTVLLAIIVAMVVLKPF